MLPPTSTKTYRIVGGPDDGTTFTLPYFLSYGTTSTTTRPITNFASIIDMESVSKSRYNALVLQIQRRMTNGLSVQANYTRSRSIDYGQQFGTFAASFMTVSDPFDLSYDKGYSGNDIPHKFVGSAVWIPATTFHLAKTGVANAIFFNMGQCCCAGSRLIAGPKVRDALVERVTEIARKTKIGPGFEPDTTVLFRYSALTFNGHRIHYDQDYARNEENYPGLVVHGPHHAQGRAGERVELAVAAARHPDVGAVRPLEAVLGLPDGAALGLGRADELHHPLAIVRVQALPPPGRGGRHVPGGVAEGLPEALVPAQGVRREVPLPDRVLGGLADQLVALGVLLQAIALSPNPRQLLT